MTPNTVLAERFIIERLAGEGGMGAVYAARDSRDGQRVALKLLRLTDEQGGARFSREVAALRALGHPRIVRYVDHGATDAGQHYLAMEWLDGADLAALLRSGPLEEASARAVVSGVAEALAHAHAHGVVHRDVKPANVLLEGRDPARAKLVDFGVARLDAAATLTRAGGLVGTPGYLAPEQVRGEPGVDARADVFALGCVWFECLAGGPAFAADDVMALLFKILVEEPASLTDLRADVPPAVARLVSAMLAKDPALRPANAAAVLAALETLETLEAPSDGEAPRDGVPTALTGAELRAVALVVAAGYATSGRGSIASAPTLAVGDRAAVRASVERAAAPYGARIEWLGDGGMIAVFRGASGPAEHVARAARCALAIQAARPDVALAIATGRAELRGAVPLGPIVDRAVALLRARSPHAPPPIVVDDTSERLLELRFTLEGGTLVGLRETPSGARPLLGRATPFVGRERERDALLDAVDRMLEERAPAAVVVTGGAGLGKSRLVHEVLAALARSHPEVAVWLAAADPMASGAPLALLAQIVRRAAGVGPDTPRDASLAALRAHVDGRIAANDRAHVEALFVELAADRPDDVAAATLRGDPAATGERIRRGFGAFLAMACATRPVIVVLEDLHWGDAASVRMLESAMAALPAAPLLVLAAARPEVRDLLPRLFERREPLEVRLTPLRPSAAKELVVSALGASADEALRARVIDRGAGNPFYLEELARAVAEGRSDALPETVLAMSVARLEALDADARRILRAASVFGETFSDAAAAALLEGSSRAELGLRLAVLVEQEVLAPDRADRDGIERPGHYRFRHALLRDAAYAMLTDADRALGHRLAGEHLAAQGREEVSVLAEHFDRAGDARAAAYYLAAARRALRGSDPDAAVVFAQRGATCSAAAPTRVLDDLLRLEAGAQSWRGDFRAVDAQSERIMAGATVGSKPWWGAAVGAVHASIFLARPRRVRRALALFRDTLPEPDAFMAYGRALGSALPVMFHASPHGTTRPLYERFAEVVGPMAGGDPMLQGMLAWLSSYDALFHRDDPWDALARLSIARQHFEAADDTQRALHCEGETAVYLGDAGDLDAHDAVNRDVWARTAHMGLGPSIGLAYLAYNLADAGREAGAGELLEWVFERTVARGFAVGEGTARAAVAQIALRRGDATAALRESVRAVKLTATTPRWAALGFATLVRARLALGDTRGALRASRAALGMLTRHAPVGPTEAAVRLAHAEALERAGDRDGAIAAARDAEARVHARAERAPDPARGDLYLASPAPSRTLAFAARLER
ncbi:MAG: protein kinase [Polyangiaceae bacterium]|nr:protein kinase [Polyangiaceae bacterium]